MDELKSLRDSLDRIDRSLIELIAERFRITGEVGQLKKRMNLPSTDRERERLQMERISALAEEYGLDPQIARSVLRLLIDEAVRNHNRIKEG
ncbi:MAG: chorismate mutase [Spirochaetales bacterium]|nr:chorismate mutase [Spirochaetales bacterium]